MGLRDGGRSKPAQTQTAGREHQHRDDTGCGSGFLRSIRSPCVQARQAFPPPQIRPNPPHQRGRNRRHSGQHVSAGNPHIQLRCDPSGQQHQTGPARDQRRQQTWMPQLLVTTRGIGSCVAVCASTFGIRSTVACPEHPGIGQNLCGQAGEVLTACEQSRPGEHGHCHLPDTEQQRPARCAGKVLPPRVVAAPEDPPHPQRPGDHRESSRHGLHRLR
ncbi:Uncharacterised protein [Mycobacteroides abscessus]|nr:Uncharacterised protein [Mycobacteroides abscessus]